MDDLSSNQEAAPTPPPVQERKTPKWLIIGGPIVAVLLIIVGYFVLVPSPEDTYLERLSDEGLGGVYASDAQAIAAGQAECRRLQDGGDPKGTEEKFAAVEIFCDDFALGYRILKEIYVEGSLSVWDEDARGNGECYIADGGYDDIAQGVEIVVMNGRGDRLTTTELEAGEEGLDRIWCQFPFSFTVLEGEDEYIVDFDRRGDFTYSETELKEPDTISLSIGF